MEQRSEGVTERSREHNQYKRLDPRVPLTLRHPTTTTTVPGPTRPMRGVILRPTRLAITTLLVAIPLLLLPPVTTFTLAILTFTLLLLLLLLLAPTHCKVPRVSWGRSEEDEMMYFAVGAGSRRISGTYP